MTEINHFPGLQPDARSFSSYIEPLSYYNAPDTPPPSWPSSPAENMDQFTSTSVTASAPQPNPNLSYNVVNTKINLPCYDDAFPVTTIPIDTPLSSMYPSPPFSEAASQGSYQSHEFDMPSSQDFVPQHQPGFYHSSTYSDFVEAQPQYSPSWAPPTNHFNSYYWSSPGSS